MVRRLEAGNPARLPWTLLALGIGAFFLGQSYLGVFQIVLQQPSPFPSAADVLFVGAYPLLLVALFGFLHAYGDGAAALAPRDATFELMRTGVKPHACCRYSQGPIDAVLALRAAHGVDARRIARVDVGIVGAGFPIVCEPIEAKRRPLH